MTKNGISVFSIKMLLFGVEIAIVFFALAFTVCLLSRQGIVSAFYIDKLANIGLKFLTITTIVAFASDFAKSILKEKTK